MTVNVFADEWRDCLRFHYIYVLRSNDKRTLASLMTVMNEAGFREDELRELAVRATAHVDDVPADFVPDLNILQPEAAVEQSVEAEPEETPPAENDSDAPKQLSLF